MYGSGAFITATVWSVDWFANSWTHPQTFGLGRIILIHKLEQKLPALYYTATVRFNTDV